NNLDSTFNEIINIIFKAFAIHEVDDKHFEVGANYCVHYVTQPLSRHCLLFVYTHADTPYASAPDNKTCNANIPKPVSKDSIRHVIRLRPDIHTKQILHTLTGHFDKKYGPNPAHYIGPQICYIEPRYPVYFDGNIGQLLVMQST